MTRPTFKEHASGYLARTRANALWGDVTIAFAVDFTTSGEKNTARFAGEKILQIPVPKDLNRIDDNEYDNLVRRSAKKVVSRLCEMDAPDGLKINIAGNALSRFEAVGIDQEDVDTFVYNVLWFALDDMPVAEIRSGGQSGADEAGIKAAMDLNIPCSIVAPHGWKYSNKKGHDIENEAQFKARFDKHEDNH